MNKEEGRIIIVKERILGNSLKMINEEKAFNLNNPILKIQEYENAIRCILG